jgi:hypothetical protein
MKMIANKQTKGKIIKSLQAGRNDFRVTGKATDGQRWPEPNHYYVIDDLVDQKTYHIPVDGLADTYKKVLEANYIKNCSC